MVAIRMTNPDKSVQSYNMSWELLQYIKQYYVDMCGLNLLLFWIVFLWLDLLNTYIFLSVLNIDIIYYKGIMNISKY